VIVHKAEIAWPVPQGSDRTCNLLDRDRLLLTELAAIAESRCDYSKVSNELFVPRRRERVSIERDCVSMIGQNQRMRHLCLDRNVSTLNVHIRP
jgi:hypothetical protein